jgi:diguanylate cyclase (GGDEF)-like protein
MAACVFVALCAFLLGVAVMHTLHARRPAISPLLPPHETIVAEHPELTALAAASMFKVNRTLQTELARTRDEVGAEKQKSQVLSAEARTDKLSGLANRRVFDEELERSIERWQLLGHQPVSLLLIDVDHFKQINDRHGHPTGDAALQWLARIASAQVDDAGPVARYGGEEFAVILTGQSEHEAIALGESLRQAIAAEPFQHGEVLLRITASLGLATSLPDETGKSLTHRADEALYAAKKNGRNRVYLHNGRLCQPAIIAPARSKPVLC